MRPLSLPSLCALVSLMAMTVWVSAHRKQKTGKRQDDGNGPQEIKGPSRSPKYTIMDGFVGVPLIGAPGTPTIGQPSVQIELNRQTEKNNSEAKPDKPYYVLVLTLPGFIGGTFEGVELFVGCMAPSTDAADTLAWNFSDNCKVGRSGLLAKCEVPLIHLASDRKNSTKCRPHDGDLSRDTVLQLALRADVIKTENDGNATRFYLWAQGKCVQPSGKATSKEKSLCDEKEKTMAQYFDFHMDRNHW